jgi:hypothetical protein
MSLFDQLDAFIADEKSGKIKPKKAAKAKKVKPAVNPLTAVKYTQPGKRLPGERHGWKEQPCPPPPKPTYYQEKRIIHGHIFIMPVYIPYLPSELAKAKYNPFAFLGCSPVWKQHLKLTEEV